MGSKARGRRLSELSFGDAAFRAGLGKYAWDMWPGEGALRAMLGICGLVRKTCELRHRGCGLARGLCGLRRGDEGTHSDCHRLRLVQKRAVLWGGFFFAGEGWEEWPSEKAVRAQQWETRPCEEGLAMRPAERDWGSMLGICGLERGLCELCLGYAAL